MQYKLKYETLCKNMQSEYNEDRKTIFAKKKEGRKKTYEKDSIY